MKKLILSLLTILVMSSLIGCDFKKESKEYKAENPKFEKSIKFKKISAPYDNIVALTEDGELYTVVKDEKKDSSVITNIASHVKDFSCSGSSIVFSKDGSLYYSKDMLTSKFEDYDYRFLNNNAKEFFLFYGELSVVLNKDKTTKVYDNNPLYHNRLISSAANEDFNNLSDVKYVVLDDDYYGYVNTKGELLIKNTHSKSFKKKLDNINKYQPTNRLFLTDNNELYAFNDMCNPVKIDDDVIEFTDEYYKTKNGEVFIPNFPAYYTATSFPKNSPLKEDIDAYEYSIKLDVKNVDTVLCSHFSINSVTYTTTDGMLVRNCNGNEQKVKLRINALNDLYNFKIQDDKAYENK